jgi:hypothetical protein
MTNSNTTPNPAPRYVRDWAGKKAFVRRAVAPGSEHLETADGWAWYIETRTGRYYVVAAK